ncbi:MAG: restriction endonuclease [Caldilineaceae bacterium]|nr:restriction endonuclease [Caldilineaceae bacterium]
MAEHSYAFRLPTPRLPRLPKVQPSFTALFTVLWVLLYGWLGYRLWANGLRVGWRLNLILITILVIIGVAIVLAWRNIGTRWVTGYRNSGNWGTLSLRELQAMDPFDFEEYVAQRLFARQGYAVINTQDSKDGGVDILVTDASGQSAVVQCKRYRGTVGSATVRELYGTMVHTGAARAFLVTSGTISLDARKWVEDKPITLIDGKRLVQLSRAAPGLTEL